MASKMVVVPLQCDVCNKQFSGPVPAEQHFASADHKKREANIRSASNSGMQINGCKVKILSILQWVKEKKEFLFWLRHEMLLSPLCAWRVYEVLL